MVTNAQSMLCKTKRRCKKIIIIHRRNRLHWNEDDICVYERLHTVCGSWVEMYVQCRFRCECVFVCMCADISFLLKDSVVFLYANVLVDRGGGE